MAGGLAGTFSWLISFPIDVVKSRLQADGIDGERKYTSTYDCIRKSYAAEGWKFFTRGVGSTLMRAFPMNAVCFLVVSYAMKLLDNATLKVNMAPKTEKLVISDSYSYPFIMRIQRNYDPEYKYNFTKYLILLDGFHEATCHTDMIETCDNLREHFSQDTSHYYKIEEIDLAPKTSEPRNVTTELNDNQRIPLLISG
jgi:solute carrier family 25 carnitine/acylcarnitine transporter 20/29